MISREVVVNLQADATARPVAILVQLASKYESKVYILAKDKKINAKSIMGMMSLGFGQGDKLTIQAEGSDAEAAVKEIADYIESVA